MIVVACLLFGFLLPAVTFAQDTATTPTETTDSGSGVKKRPHPREAYPPDQRPEENYLARFKAIEISQKLMDSNIEDIYMLNVIVSNFKDQGWKEDYDKIYDEYKKAVSKYYRREVIYSRLELERNKKNINNLFRKVYDVYQNQAQDLLDQCADKIMDFDLDESNKYDPNRSRVLFQNMTRLWIAYGQIDDAESSNIDNQFKASVYHIRIAKSYAIKILEQLDPKGSEGDKFKVHKADNLNRILTASSSDSATK